MGGRVTGRQALSGVTLDVEETGHVVVARRGLPGGSAKQNASPKAAPGEAHLQVACFDRLGRCCRDRLTLDAVKPAVTSATFRPSQRAELRRCS